MNSQATLTSDPSRRTATGPTIRVVAFPLHTLNLALRVESVERVLNNVPIYSSGLNSFGITHVGDREITVLDLQNQLFRTKTLLPRQGNDAPISPYLVVIQNSAGEAYGIPINAPPALTEIPANAIRILTSSYRRSDTLGIASHVAQVKGDTAPKTIFLLDVDRVIPA
ncbi:MAG: chemotaxis protein CheW [Cyanobacteria bacterium P01_D01_bin.123]